MKEAVRKALQRALAPLLVRFDRVDGRLDRLEDHAREMSQRADRQDASFAHLVEVNEAYLARAGTAEDLIGRSLMEQRVRLEAVEDALVGIRQMVAMRELPAEELSLDMLDERGAWYLNRATGWRGFASRAGVYVNEPINVNYDTGSVGVVNVNERIAELPFVYSEVLRTPPPARVLDVGSRESPVALALATLGYEVTAADPRGYAFPHPNITVQQTGAEDLPDGEVFDVAVLLSVIEHVGIGHYVDADDADADIAVLRRVRDVVRPGGRLVLTTPFGHAAQDEVQRIYDPARLARLLEGWEVDRVVVLERRSETEWAVVGTEIEVPDGDAFRVIMVTAGRPTG